MLSLLLPFGVGIITRLALRTRGQQRQPLTIDAPWWALTGGWALSVLIALLGLAEPMQRNLSAAVAMIMMASVVGLLIPEIFRGLGSATTSGLSKPRNWLWLGAIGTVLYGLFINPEVLEGLLLLGMTLLFLGVILGWKPTEKKKKGGG
jgi:hypothetical protein